MSFPMNVFGFIFVLHVCIGGVVMLHVNTVQYNTVKLSSNTTNTVQYYYSTLCGEMFINILKLVFSILLTLAFVFGTVKVSLSVRVPNVNVSHVSTKTV